MVVENFFLTNPSKVCLNRNEILIKEFDVKENKSVSTNRLPEQVGEIAFISDKASISKGAIKKLEGRNS